MLTISSNSHCQIDSPQRKKFVSIDLVRPREGEGKKIQKKSINEEIAGR